MADAGHLHPTEDSLANVALPHVMHNVVDLPGHNAGFLGSQCNPLQVTHDPNCSDFSVPNLTLPRDVPSHRMTDRLALTTALQNLSNLPSGNSVSLYHQQATQLLHNRKLQRAFRLDDKPDPTRDYYGRNTLGQSLLLARKLVESGVRFINVNDKIYNGQDVNWDSHLNVFPRHRELLPSLEQGFSALLTDLQDRGLLDSTLVVATGEFGRSPRINANAGRDHWPDCYSTVLAGGGVNAGS